MLSKEKEVHTHTQRELTKNVPTDGTQIKYITEMKKLTDQSTVN